MSALEYVGGFTTAAGAALTAVTSNGGPLTVRNFTKGDAWLLQVWAQKQVNGGTTRIRSPRFHDNTNGISLRNNFPSAGGGRQILMPYGFPQRLIAQDTLTWESSGSATAGDIENSGGLILYENLDGANARFIDLTQLESRMVNIFTVVHALIGGTAGVFGAAQALSAAASGDTTKANTDYALLGMTMSESTPINACTVRVTGVDTGNLGIGIPVIPESNDITANWFLDLTKKYGRPLIPVINSANKGGTVFDVLNDENANTVTVTSIFAELR